MWVGIVVRSFMVSRALLEEYFTALIRYAVYRWSGVRIHRLLVRIRNGMVRSPLVVLPRMATDTKGPQVRGRHHGQPRLRRWNHRMEGRRDAW
jgi:hypothetical protein